jgi:hypothetical protein
MANEWYQISFIFIGGKGPKGFTPWDGNPREILSEFWGQIPAKVEFESDG